MTAEIKWVKFRPPVYYLRAIAVGDFFVLANAADDEWQAIRDNWVDKPCMMIEHVDVDHFSFVRLSDGSIHQMGPRREVHRILVSMTCSPII